MADEFKAGVSDEESLCKLRDVQSIADYLKPGKKSSL